MARPEISLNLAQIYDPWNNPRPIIRRVVRVIRYRKKRKTMEPDLVEDAQIVQSAADCTLE